MSDDDYFIDLVGAEAVSAAAAKPHQAAKPRPANPGLDALFNDEDDDDDDDDESYQDEGGEDDDDDDDDVDDDEYDYY